ncbi:hypothetical protein [Mechercharimyces sp. CAU 1602]|uniref:hypothetical protein n=1 Tax=Mechercharimyces sp. CAU 1602 TaxID=2973933 RepID=UPI002162BC50|nr:hypothetical protein [Mechercharimyces sp. CAU 1602]MCS1351128.1 hypothetical protein [Mechercharimyces sp. CAU 1602]
MEHKRITRENGCRVEDLSQPDKWCASSQGERILISVIASNLVEEGLITCEQYEQLKRKCLKAD